MKQSLAFVKVHGLFSVDEKDLFLLNHSLKQASKNSWRILYLSPTFPILERKFFASG